MSDYENDWDKPFESRRQQRRREAEERQAARNKRTPGEQLARLNKLGHRAVRERAKLEALLDQGHEQE